MLKVVALMALLIFSVSANDKVDLDGHNPGRFTMDYDAAKKYAQEKGLPIFIDFTGSDWCGWCKLMDKNVFSQEEWSTYAKDNLVLVYIDFPKNKSLVPDKYVERNKELKQKFPVKGFPTYFVIDPNTEAVMGKLGAGQTKTAQSFIGEVDSLIAMTPANIAKFAKTLSPEKSAEFLATFEKMNKNNKDLESLKKAYEEKAQAVAKENNELEEKLIDTRVLARIKPEQAEEYFQAKKELKLAEGAMEEFAKSEPENNAENMAKFKEIQTKIAEAKAKLAKF